MDQKSTVHLHNGILHSGEKKGLLSFATAWVELESIMLSEVSQEVKDKYHMISPKSGTKSTQQTIKQNITRDIEIKNKLAVTIGERERDNGKNRERVFREHI